MQRLLCIFGCFIQIICGFWPYFTSHGISTTLILATKVEEGNSSKKNYYCYLLFQVDIITKTTELYSFYRIEWVRHCSFWKHLSNYFPVRIIKTAELDSEKGNYLLGSHPHGILCSGAFISLATEGAGWAKKFPNLVPHLLMLPAYFQVPGMREFMLLLGKTSSQTKDQVCCA